VSLLDDKTGKNAFYDENNEFGMSKLMRNWIGGLIKYAKEYTYFLAPYVNSYKRLQPNTYINSFLLRY
jgi:glutamine synthetase